MRKKKRFSDRDSCCTAPCSDNSSPREELKHRVDEKKRCKKNLKRHLKNRDSLIEMSDDYIYPRNEMLSLIGANTVAIDNAKDSYENAVNRLKEVKKKKK